MADSEDELAKTDDENPSPDAENYKNTENTAQTPQSPKKVFVATFCHLHSTGHKTTTETELILLPFTRKT